jgi:hypothetical protein
MAVPAVLPSEHHSCGEPSKRGSAPATIEHLSHAANHCRLLLAEIQGPRVVSFLPATNHLDARVESISLYVSYCPCVGSLLVNEFHPSFLCFLSVQYSPSFHLPHCSRHRFHYSRPERLQLRLVHLQHVFDTTPRLSLSTYVSSLAPCDSSIASLRCVTRPAFHRPGTALDPLPHTTRAPSFTVPRL